MRILVMNYEYPPVGGGGGFVTKDIFEQIAGAGHSVTVVTSGYKELKKQENVNGVDVIRVPVLFRDKMEVASLPSMLSYFPSSLFKSICGINVKTYDIINTHFAIPSGPSGYILSRFYHLPNVLSIHGGDIFDPSKSLSPHKTLVLSSTVSAMINNADCVVAQSNDTKNNACKYYDVKKDIEIIPLCIKKPEFMKKTRQDFALAGDETIFITVGRLVTRKNIPALLSVLREMKNRFKFKLIIIGDGPERKNIENYMNQYGLQKYVLLCGNVSDEEKFQLLDLSDIYLSTSMHEGFGLVFLEAMECGLPVLCYNKGGQIDFLIDGETGYLVNPGDDDMFRQKLIELVSDPGKRQKISAYNRKYVQNFYVNVCAERYISLFENVITKHKSAQVL